MNKTQHHLWSLSHLCVQMTRCFYRYEHRGESQHLEEPAPTSQTLTVYSKLTLDFLCKHIRRNGWLAQTFHRWQLHAQRNQAEAEGISTQPILKMRPMNALLPVCHSQWQSGLGEPPRHLPNRIAKPVFRLLTRRALGHQVLRQHYAQDANLQAKCYTRRELIHT